MAKKQIRHLREGQTEFQKVFSRLCDTKSAWQVWSDFVEMTAISISNTVEIREKVKQEREARYMTIIGTYTKKEQAIFPELVNILVQSLQRSSEQDFLGEMFMSLELGNHWKGQFFTPYCVCKAMAAINIEDAKDKVTQNGYITINDPACGAGATLIAVRNALSLAKIGGTQAFFIGQDIDRTAAMMCYVQLSLLGCAGYVVVADTMRYPITGKTLWPNLNENQDAWFMPLNYMEPAWVLRLMKASRLDFDIELDADSYEVVAESTCDEIVTEPQEVAEDEPKQAEPQEPPASPDPEISFVETEIGQLTLF